jgi:hypothetical protein
MTDVEKCARRRVSRAAQMNLALRGSSRLPSFASILFPHGRERHDDASEDLLECVPCPHDDDRDMGAPPTLRERRLARARALHLEKELADVRLDDHVDAVVVLGSRSGPRARHPRRPRGEKARFERVMLVCSTAFVSEPAEHAGDVPRVHVTPTRPFEA